MRPVAQIIIAAVLVTVAIVVAALAVSTPPVEQVDASILPRFDPPADRAGRGSVGGAPRLVDLDPFSLQQGVRRTLGGMNEPPPPPLDLPAPPILPLGANSP